MTPTIRLAGPADAGALASFAARTFFETYSAANDPADMADFLTARYGEAIQAVELRDPTTTYLMAEMDGALAGFGFLRFGRVPDDVVLDRPVELMRFYVAREWHGHGVAQVLMATCVEEARRRGARTLWLSVWQENARAIAFYKKSGFALAGTVRFELGSQLQDDYMMTLPLDAERPASTVGPR